MLVSIRAFYKWEKLSFTCKPVINRFFGLRCGKESWSSPPKAPKFLHSSVQPFVLTPVLGQSLAFVSAFV